MQRHCRASLQIRVEDCHVIAGDQATDSLQIRVEDRHVIVRGQATALAAKAGAREREWQ